MLQKRTTVPNHAQLFWPVVTAFRELGGSADKHQLVDKVAEIMGLSEEARVMPHKNGPGTELSYRVGWVQSWLKWGQMLENPRRGVWVLNQLGRVATREDVEDVIVRRKAAQTEARTTELEAQIKAEQEEEQSWQSDLLSTIKRMPPSAFERLAKRLLLEIGFSNVLVTGGSGDGGIDAIGQIKMNSVLTFKVIVQCKRFKGSVGSKDLRDFRGAMQGRTDKAIFITTGTFTDSARNEASRDGVPAIDLVEGKDLAVLLKELKLGVETKLVEEVTVQHTFFDDV